MDTNYSTLPDDADAEALRAGILANSQLIALKQAHEQQVQATLDSIAITILRDAFRLGFEAGQKSKES